MHLSLSEIGARQLGKLKLRFLATASKLLLKEGRQTFGNLQVGGQAPLLAIHVWPVTCVSDSMSDTCPVAAPFGLSLKRIPSTVNPFPGGT